MRKTLLMGGRFDPIHAGHLLIAREVKEQLGFSEVIFVPSADPPHKPTVVSFAQRAEMVRIAIKNEPGFDFCGIEGQRQGKSYTVDTVASWHQCGFDEVYWLVGADNIEQIPTWHDYDRLKRITKFIAVARPDIVFNKEFPVGLDLQFVNISKWPISSTQIRKRIKKGQSVRFLIPESVEDYIRTNKLYQ